jgi:FkbM family methyltransferase
MGQYAKLSRKLGFKGEIISFEPLSKAYEILVLEAENDKKWNTYNFALGNKHEEIAINVSKNLFSSSILGMTAIHSESAIASHYQSQEKIIVKTINDIHDNLFNEDDVVLLKIDVQGFEKNVIEGASSVIHKIKGVQIEMSLVELYEGEMLFFQMADLLSKHGFSLYSLENGFYNNDTGQLLQVDGIFFRN